jgi:pimeloyl-ACP methyl ester carboxylesterase
VLIAVAMNPPAFADDCAVLLHGLWRTENSMGRMEKSLAEAGYRVLNIEYESTEKPIALLAEEAVREGVDGCQDADSIHFVTHSMGGILLRQFLEQNEIPRLGRVVMLGPPNQGSEVIDRYGDLPGFEWFSGPAGLQLGTGEASVPRSLGPAHFDLGIIAGTQSVNPILSRTLPGPDDGKVSVDATRVDGMDDHLELPVTHVFMMRDKEVIEQVQHFLANGQFKRAAESGSSGAVHSDNP